MRSRSRAKEAISVTSRMCAAAVVVAAFSTLPLAASADPAKTSRVRQSATLSPPKDCTRFNGRFGYYANPWCSYAEQERWDRWEAARAKRR